MKRKLIEQWKEEPLLKNLELIKSGVKPFKGNKKYIDTGSVYTGKIIDFVIVDYKTRPSRANIEVQKDDVIFAKMKDTEKVYLISSNDQNNLYSTGFSVLRSKDKSKILPKYVYYWLRTKKFQDKKNKECSGATQKAIRESKLKDFTMIIPSIQSQEKIISILEKAEKLKGLRDESDKLTKEFLKSTFLEMFGDPIKNPNGWKSVTPLDICANVKNTITIGPFGSNLMVKDYRKQGTPLVFVKNIRENRFFGDDTKFVDSSKTKELDSCKVISGDVLMTKMGDPPGDVAIYPHGVKPAIITADCIKITIDPHKALNLFVLWMFRTKYVQDQILQQTRGVAQKKINLSIFKSIKFPLPDISLQQKFVDIVKLVEKTRIQQSKSEIEIKNFHNLLTAKLFKGELAC